MRIHNRFIGTESIQQTDSTAVESISNQKGLPPSGATQTAAANSSAIAADNRGILDTRAAMLQKSLHDALDARTVNVSRLEPTGIEFPNLVKEGEPSMQDKNAAAMKIPGRIEFPNLTIRPELIEEVSIQGKSQKFLPEVNDEVLILGNSDTVHGENETDHAYQHNQSDLEFLK